MAEETVVPAVSRAPESAATPDSVDPVDSGDGSEYADVDVEQSEAEPFVVRRPRLVTSFVLNIFAFAGLWVAYSSIRTLTAESVGTARSNAIRLVRFQDWIGLPSEATVQRMLLPYDWVVKSANVYYIGFHFPVMIAFLLWAMLWKREWMPRVRVALIGSSLVGLAIHLAVPMAPPRMLRVSGFVDTARLFGPDPYALGISKAANELAAMPSLHVGWALIIALAVIASAKSRWRWLILLHPIITTIVVIVTANHYWTDVFVGALLCWLGWWLAGKVRPLPRPQVTAAA